MYVPSGLVVLVDKGSGIVGRPAPNGGAYGAESHADDNGRVLVDFEGNRYGAANIVTYADRVYHAYGRMVDDYPTVARNYLKAEQLLQIGWFEPEDGVVDVNDYDALAEWLGVEEVDEDELHTTHGRR